MFGRNGESPLPILAAATPADCFDLVQEAMRIAVDFMCPVIFLSDGYIANGAEPWRIPKLSDLKPVVVKHPTEWNSPDGFLPYKRDERYVRPWAADRHEGARTSRRRARKSGRDRQRRILARQSPAHDRHPAAEGCRHCRLHSRADCRRARDGRPAGRQLGRHVRHGPHGRATSDVRGQERRSLPPAVHESVPAESRGHFEEL